MITKSNFEDMLKVLGFQKDGVSYEKAFTNVGAHMSADFSAQKLHYPEEIKGGERNDGFDSPENFVVFECVNRLLDKGYRPENIELEKEWHLGHDAKSGRADICVTDGDGVMLFLIECKTWGREFDKALKDTQNDGAQLFSYWQQEQASKWLVLYASEFMDGCVKYKAPTIDCSDDANILLLAKKDKSIKLYRDAHTTEERYEAWKETYACNIHEDLVFSEDSVAYQIGVKPLLKKDLKDFTPDDKIVNKFEEILRHNNVSDKENAFNRLVALFICKLVDEITKGENDEVEFQYKQGTDTYETLQDRLQRLHRDGMEKFMREEIFYVPSDYPEWLFSTYTGSKRKKAIEDLQNTIRILKFYSNNDFAFKDVHNEELFYQNGKILVEMVQLFEKYRIVYPSKHQFLGDLFEQLLNKGFKQNEGQFFTPMPITRFIWDCLPVDKMLKSERGTVYPKVIDYACGAGHFLTEAVEAIDFFADADGDNSWVRDHIYGIEKDYRLARVAKISLFMNGAGEGNIIFGDGLENAPDKGIEAGSFDILVSNPPYSVKDFKQHLQLKNNSFTLLDRIGINAGEIETLFVERISQLLKPQGVAAVILPSSILSNNSASYTGAREQILQNFLIRGIVALGSKTFGATGTNTVIMFLEKYNEPPKMVDLSSDSVDAIFNGGDIAEWKDKEILDAYLTQIGVDDTAYGNFLNRSVAIEDLKSDDYFKMYVTAFENSSEARKLLNTKAYKRKSSEAQATEYLGKFYDYASSIERDKLLYFSLVYRQSTIVITAPSDNKAQKEFLGYDWSNRKGNEGIQIVTPGGKLYNDADRKANDTVASFIRKSFDDAILSIKEEQESYASAISTKEMLDFTRASFDKALRLNVKKLFNIKSTYPLYALSSLVEIISGGTPDTNIPEYWGGDIPWLSVNDFNTGFRYVQEAEKHITKEGLENSNTNYLKQDDLIISARGTVGVVAQIKNEMTFNQSCYGLRSKGEISSSYLYYILLYLRKDIESLATGSKFPSIVRSTFDLIKVPVPPIEIQNQIINECEKVDVEYENTRMSIEEYRKKIEDLFDQLDVISRGGGID